MHEIIEPNNQPRSRQRQRQNKVRRRPLHRRILWIVGSLVAILFMVFLIQGTRISLQLRIAYEQARQFAQIANNDLTEESYLLARASLQNSADAVTNSHEIFAMFVPTLRLLHWVPGIGEDFAAVPILVDTGQQLTDLAVAGFDIAKPLLVSTEIRSPLVQLPTLYVEAESELAEIQHQVDTIYEELHRIDANKLSPLLREPVQDLQAAISLIAPGLRLGTYLPDLLGVGEPRTYLVLAQNNHELRATGGFLTAVGRVSLLDGKVVGVEFVDSYDRSISRIDLSLPQAPPPVQRHMGIEIMLLRDANWSPDFPTTAQIIRTIYSQQTGRTVDGVISVDLQAVELFVKALEPLRIAGVEEPLTGETVLAQLTEFWAAPVDSEATLESGDTAWWQQRKDFIPKLVDAALARIQRGQFDYLQMLSAVQQSLDTRAIQLWFANAEVSRELANIGWDGRLQPSRDGDFLAVVDTNFGFNKVNAVVEQEATYQIDWPDGLDQPAVATLSLTYRHPYERPNYTCDQTPHYEGSYEEMIVRCYFNYLRVYTPADSELLGSQGLQPETIVSQRGERGAQLFGGYFILSPGTEETIILQYRLPSHITPENYTLTVRRQAGTGPLPFQAQVRDQFIATTIKRGSFTWP